MTRSAHDEDLVAAAEAVDVEGVGAALKAGADVDTRDQPGVLDLLRGLGFTA